MLLKRRSPSLLSLRSTSTAGYMPLQDLSPDDVPSARTSTASLRSESWSVGDEAFECFLAIHWRTPNKLTSSRYRCRCTCENIGERGQPICAGEVDSAPSSFSTQVEFCEPFRVKYDYDKDTTLRFELFSAPRERPPPPNLPVSAMSVENVVIRLRNPLSDPMATSWTPLGSFECDLNGLAHRGVASGHVATSPFAAADVSVFAERAPIVNSSTPPSANHELRFDVTATGLERRGKLKHIDMDVYLQIHRRLDKSGTFAMIYSSEKTADSRMTISTHSVDSPSASHALYRFPEFVLQRSSVLGDRFDRQLRFTLINAATGDVIGETETSYSQLLHGSHTFKLSQRDSNGNTLFGVGRRAHNNCVGQLHVNVFVDQTAMNGAGAPSRSTAALSLNSIGEDACSTSSGSSSCSTLNDSSMCAGGSNRNSRSSTKSSSEEEYRSVVDKEVLYVDGNTQAYLISLVAPTKRVILQPSYAQAKADQLTAQILGYR
ncbi:hypothetical protein QR680_017905 [Steinernema hermaphroditum]|uniref:Uncharacterized protein n=1 Tax=Steinernema hermaphroditum TaxID=289476 RepID=A0AA39LQ51_9BILA|nr:hypothetical protein QR680_017905 [Steinernema hermaphroditum]